MKRNITNLILLLVFINFTNCKEKKIKINKPDKAFATYIDAFTNGIISNSDKIIIRLSKEYPVKKGEIIRQNIFEFDPSIDGKTYWEDPYTIVFKPHENFKRGTLFKGIFHLGKIEKVPEKLKDFKFQFQTKNQDFDISFQGMQATNKRLTKNRITGKITTADYAFDKNIEKMLTATQNGKSLPIEWSHNDDLKWHTFNINDVVRWNRNSEVIIKWDGKPIEANRKGTKKIEIPSLRSFALMNVETKNEPDQQIILHFSDPINKNQNLDGLIILKSKTKLTFSKNGNEIKLFPKKSINGNDTLLISRSIRNSLGYRLQQNYFKPIYFNSIKPAIKAIGKGTIIPNDQGVKFPFKAVNLKAVNVKIIKIFSKNIHQFLQVNQLDGKRELTRVGRIIYNQEVPLLSDQKDIDYGKWNTFALDLSKMISVEPGAIYRLEMSFNKNQSLYNCPDKAQENINLTQNKIDNSEFEGPKSNDYYDYYEDESEYYFSDFDYDERNNPCSNSYYYLSKRKIKRNIFASNLGIIAKEDTDHTLNITVSDILSTNSLSNVKIDIYNFQNQKIGSTATNSDGLASIKLDEKPFLLVAQKNKQYGYLRLDDASSLSMSMFDVGGKKIKKGIKGYIYGERGIWRPGDSIHLSLILEDKNQSLPENHPVVLELYTPQNQLFDRKVKSNSINNFYTFHLKTPQDAQTGNWTARVKVGGTQFSKTLKIEAIKPNRLKIKLHFDSEILHSGSKPIKLEAQWLHGAPASNLKTIVEMRTFSTKTHFKDFPEYHFDDPSVSFNSESQTIFEGKLNAKGKAQIPLKLNIEQAPGMVNLSFKTRVFEQGGDFSIDRQTKKYSPYNSYVGIKIPKGTGWNDALFSDDNILIPIVSVDEYGNPINRKKLKIEVYEISSEWWWERDMNENLGYYLTSGDSKKIITDYVSTTNGKAIYNLKFPKATWGRKFIRITDPVSGHSTGKIFYTTYKDWWNNPDNVIPGSAEILSFSTDKKSYKPGDEAKISLPVSKQGRALISIENGSQVLLSFWTNVSPSNHTASFSVTKEMSPNVYIHISYIQPHHQTDNDRPIRLYGVQNIHVENPDSHLHPQIIMADELQPEKEYWIKVKEKNGNPMTYTLAVVDEGLLDITRFKTPNPWNNFYSRQALGVKTYDMYSYVMGAFNGKLAGIFAIGGDEDLVEKGNRKANRFKPVVQFIGPFSLKKGEIGKHRLKMPNYIGAVRVMLVAGNTKKAAYGNAEKTVPVKKPLMVLTSLPRVLGPNEHLKLPVSIFVNDKKIKNVKLSLQTNNLIKNIGNPIQNIHFNQPGEQMVNFDLQVAKKIGIGKIKVTVEGNGIKSYEETEIQVRIANPEITHIKNQVIEAGQNWSIDYQALGIKGTNKATLEVSNIPPINLKKRLDYLITYPHGCIEQTTSSVFPQLYLDDLMNLPNTKKSQIKDNITAGLERLKKFQLNNGGFSYWPGESGYPNDWGTNYAGHFLLEAQRKGYALPPNMLSNWIKYQRKRANDWSENPYKKDYDYYTQSNQLTQAYRLYTLALAGKPELGAMNRLRETSRLSNIAKWQLAAAYYISGKQSVAEDIIKNLDTKTQNYIELNYTYGSGLRDKAIILETLTLMNKKILAKQVLEEVASELASDQWLSTQTTAYALMAVSKFVGDNKTKEKMKFTVHNSGMNKNIQTDKNFVEIPLVFDKNKKSNVQLTNQTDKVLFARLTNQGIPLQSDHLAFENNLKMYVNYRDLQGNLIDESQLKQGTDFIIEITVKHPGILKDYKNMALTEIFPSGWEITNPRMDNIQKWKSDSSTYQDVRDDRVMTYFDLDKSSSKTFRIMANASYLGKFYLPSIKCEAMYDNNIISITNGKWVKIVK